MNRRKLFVLFSITGVYFFAFFQRVAVPGTLFNELQSAFLVSAAVIAALGAIYLYIYGGMQLLAGILADTIGASKTLVIGGSLLAAGSLFFPFSASIAHLYVFRALVGLGSSLIYISMLKHINISFKEEDFPFVLAISIVLGYSGGLFATYPFERTVSLFGWQNSLAGIGAVCAVAVVAMSCLLKNSFAAKKSRYSFLTIKNILQNRSIRPVLFSGSGNFSVYFVIQATIGKKMLQDFSGITSAQAAAFTFLMMFTTMLSVLIHGFLGRRTSRRKPFAIAAALFTITGATLILLNLAIFRHTSLFLVSYLLCACAGGNILNATLVKELNAPEAAGTAVGFYNGVMYSSVALVGNLAGVVMDFYKSSAVVTEDAIIYPAESYMAIFSGCTLLGLISLVSSLRIREPQGPKPEVKPMEPENTPPQAGKDTVGTVPSIPAA